jgi:hypothetical protein
MHGLIFVTWEKYLAERFSTSFLALYREKIGETPATAPLTSRVYDDKLLLTGVATVNELTRVPVDSLLREYGRYFLMNGLTGSLCSHLLTRVHSGRELLLTMRDAHTQMRRMPAGLTPPVFTYDAVYDQDNALTLIYDSSRQLCPLLCGAIEGAAARYGQQVQIREIACMRYGAPACRFSVIFSPQEHTMTETAAQMAYHVQQQQIDNTILATLPWQQGITLVQLQNQLQGKVPATNQRLSLLLKSLQHLSHVGLVADSANEPDDTLTSRRYWRAPTFSARN